jgi:hypothetical protein
VTRPDDRDRIDGQLIRELIRKGLVQIHLYGRGERRWFPRAVTVEIQDRGLGQIIEDGR